MGKCNSKMSCCPSLRDQEEAVNRSLILKGIRNETHTIRQGHVLHRNFSSGALKENQDNVKNVKESNGLPQETKKASCFRIWRSRRHPQNKSDASIDSEQTNSMEEEGMCHLQNEQEQAISQTTNIPLVKHKKSYVGEKEMNNHVKTEKRSLENSSYKEEERLVPTGEKQLEIEDQIRESFQHTREGDLQQEKETQARLEDELAKQLESEAGDDFEFNGEAEEVKRDVKNKNKTKTERQEIERLAAERLKREEIERLETAERSKREEIERLETAERSKREEIERLEAERLKRQEIERFEVERLKRQEIERLEAERLKREEIEQLDAERLKREEIERLEEAECQKYNVEKRRQQEMEEGLKSEQLQVSLLGRELNNHNKNPEKVTVEDNPDTILPSILNTKINREEKRKRTTKMSSGSGLKESKAESQFGLKWEKKPYSAKKRQEERTCNLCQMCGLNA